MQMMSCKGYGTQTRARHLARLLAPKLFVLCFEFPIHTGDVENLNPLWDLIRSSRVPLHKICPEEVAGLGFMGRLP